MVSKEIIFNINVGQFIPGLSQSQLEQWPIMHVPRFASLQTCLCYLSSEFLLKGLKKLDYYRSRFFFGKVMVTKRNTGWQDGAFCAVLGVLEVYLGITNLDAQNVCLLSKWLFKLLNEDGTWQQLLRRKNLKNTTLAKAVKKPDDSQF